MPFVLKKMALAVSLSLASHASSLSSVRRVTWFAILSLTASVMPMAVRAP